MSKQIDESNNTPQFPQFEGTDLNFSTEFRSENKASINSSSQQVFLPLSTNQYTVKISVWVIPRQIQQAILNAEIPKLDNNWPSGIVKLYRDGDYVGQRNWSNTSADTVQ